MISSIPFPQTSLIFKLCECLLAGFCTATLLLFVLDTLPILQLGGCLLLLYRRTRLLGVMILLPVMSNILFINVFYGINPGALNTSVFILLCGT